MPRVKLRELIDAIEKSWCKETAYGNVEWSRENPSRGQCVPTAIVIQDYFGGDIIRYDVLSNGFSETHYVNYIEDGLVIDATKDQYSGIEHTINLKSVELKGFRSVRDKRLADIDTRRRYTILKEKVAKELAE